MGGCQNLSTKKIDESLDDNDKIETDVNKNKLENIKNSDNEKNDLEEENDFQEDDIEFQFTILHQDISNNYEEQTYNLTAFEGDTLYEALSRHYNVQLDEGIYFSIVDLGLYGDSPESAICHFTFNGKSSSMHDLVNMKIEDNFDIVMQYEELSPVSYSFNEDDSDTLSHYTENDYGVREVPIYENVANYTPDMSFPIVFRMRVYTTPRGKNVSESFGGTFTVDYGTTLLEALNAAYGFEAENGSIIEIGGVRAIDLGYDEFYAEWSSVSRVKEVNMSGYILEPDDSIAIYKR